MCAAAAQTWQSHLGSGCSGCPMGHQAGSSPCVWQSPHSNPENCTALSLCCLSSCLLTRDVDKTVNGVRQGQGKFGETWQLLSEAAPKHPLPGVPKPGSLGAQPQLECMFPPAQRGFWYQPGGCVLSCTGKQECRTSINQSDRPSKQGGRAPLLQDSGLDGPLG